VLLSDLLDKLRTDAGDPDGTVFTEAEYKRALARAVIRVNADLGTSYAGDDTELTPDPSDAHLEALLVAAHAFLAGMRRFTSASSGMVFQSGDKRVDKSKAFTSWAALADSLWRQYRDLVCALTGAYPDEDILTPHGLNPLIYDRTSEYDEEAEAWRS